MTQSRKPLPEQALRSAAPGEKFHSRPYDVHNLYVSLKQWRILHAVIDCGGYAEAAKSLHLSQSTISYTVSRLQENLGMALLRIEGRKAVLTAEGRVLLERSRQVLKEAIELETYAKNLGCGGGGEVRLMVDHQFPGNLLMRALDRFRQNAGMAQVRLQEVVGLPADEVLRDMAADLVISEHVPLGFLGEPLVEIDYLPVAHPDHPLLRLGRDVTAADFAQQTQICIGGLREAEKLHRHQARQQETRWIMNSFDSALAAIQARLGYAWLPAHCIQTSLEHGTLKLLPLGSKRAEKVMLYLIHGRPWPASQATGRLAELLRSVSELATEQSCLH